LLNAWQGQTDSAHDLAHVMRVRKNALDIQASEGGDLDVITAAVWLHDLVNLAKDDPKRNQASRLSAQGAANILQNIPSFPADKIEAVQHAIEAHSFSASITPKSLEAKIVQDADRLDALGAIGIARCFAVSGALGRPLLHPHDPLCIKRDPDDSTYAVDHFFVKLFKLPQTMQTKTAQDKAKGRVTYMKDFLNKISDEQCF